MFQFSQLSLQTDKKRQFDWRDGALEGAAVCLIVRFPSQKAVNCFLVINKTQQMPN